MSAATNLVYRPILVTQRQFPRLNRFSTFKLDFSRKFLSRTSISHSTRYPLPPMMDSVKNQGAAGDEGVTLGGLEQEALSMNIGSGGIEAALNSLHDMEAVWATSGGIINICLSIVLKRILNQERPVSTLRSDPGMPSSHAHYIFYTLTFCIHSIVATSFTTTSHIKPSSSGYCNRILFFHFLALVVECRSHESIYSPLLGSVCSCWGYCFLYCFSPIRYSKLGS
ncbi:lipid phosphate phosphatase epsilon 1, chloroplastic-like isoform X1 [Nicotiana sylvestris]|uniref:lipid phosphate phosphatase epsilon 1, chloroplastic-like isoform X1 n=1 Tax=Nicotiana sylvestris TaxID=4096 RepID=UPI00388C3921